MFLLTDSLEETVLLGGRKIKLDMAFDVVLTAMDVVADELVQDEDKANAFVYLMSDLEFSDIEEISFEEKYVFMVSVINIFTPEGEETKEYDLEGNPMPVVKEKDSYSLTQDAEYIYSSFMQAYGMDLIDMQGKLHWQKFRALLNGLPEETMFKQVVDIRTRDLPTGKGSADEKKRIMKLKRLYALKGQELEEGE